MGDDSLYTTKLVQQRLLGWLSRHKLLSGFGSFDSFGLRVTFSGHWHIFFFFRLIFHWNSKSI